MASRYLEKHNVKNGKGGKFSRKGRSSKAVAARGERATINAIGNMDLRSVPNTPVIGRTKNALASAAVLGAVGALAGGPGGALLGVAVGAAQGATIHIPTRREQAREVRTAARALPGFRPGKTRNSEKLSRDVMKAGNLALAQDEAFKASRNVTRNRYKRIR